MLTIGRPRDAISYREREERRMKGGSEEGIRREGGRKREGWR